MQHRLLFTVVLVLAGRGSYAQAQYTLAGQVAGTASVTLTPVVSLSGQAIYSAAGGGSAQSQPLDIDSDSRVDLVISATGYAGSAGNYPSHSAAIQLKHPDIELYTAAAVNAAGPTCFGLASGDTLQPVMHQRNAAGVVGTWSSGSTAYNGVTTYNPLALSTVANGALGQYWAGDWHDLQMHYVGFRLRASPTAPWRYGWLRLQATSIANPVTLNLQAYALATTALGVQSARAAGWQLYPTQVADWLILEPPTAAGRGQVTVQDLCGRPVLRAALSGSRQQLDLVGLAAGCYLVQFDTPAGHFVQRIVKQ